ncbi:hypothetical protein JCM10212_001953 [Sporobolomyces blumeae]
MSVAGRSSSPDAMDGRRSASPDRMALKPSDTSDSHPTVGEKEEASAAQSRKGSKGVTLADDRAGQGDESARDAYPPSGRRSRQGTRDTQRSENPSLRRRVTDLFVAEHPIKHEPTWTQSATAIVRASWLNVLLVFIPVGWAVHFSHQNDTIVFLAIIPLAKLLGFGTEELALRVGQALGGLLNATLGNAVELIVAIIALAKCEIQVVQSSLLGSILSNLLLVLGMCFFVGGVKYSEQGFKDTAAQLNSSLLVMAVFAILLPAGYNAAFQDNLTAEAEQERILKMSRGTAVILLVVYLAYLIFQLFTHQHLYAEGHSSEADANVRDGRQVWRGHRAFRQAKSVRRPRVVEEAVEEEEEEEELPQINVWSALILLVVVTVLTAEFLVSSINGLTEAHPEVSTEWVALILLPIVGNAAEHVTAVSVSVHDKIDLSMGVAVGSSIQIALFVIPLLVILGWIMNKPLSLLFDPFESIILFLSVLIANYTMQDGRSNWLEGFLLMMIYIIIAVSIWYYPTGGSAAFAC